jgi:HlyD family secretion protein
MQPHANPQPEVSPKPAGPQIVPDPHEERGGNAKWFILIALLAVAGAGYYFWNQRQQAEQQAAATQATFRTATVQQGTVEKRLRLTGVTGAGKFVSLIAPQIRGSRSGRGRGNFNLASMDSLQVSSVKTTNSGVNTASGSAGAAGAAGSLASTGGNQTRSIGGSGATRAASSRVQSAAAQKSSGISSSGGTGASGGSGGSDGLGTTSSKLGNGLGNPGGGGGGGSFGGGGGGGDFTLVLQSLVKPGSMVRKGDQVAEFDRQYMLQRLEDYKATLETAKAQLTQQRENLALARHTHELNVEKAKAALDKAKLDIKTLPVMSQIDTEKLKLALEEAEAQYKQQVAEGKFIEQAEKAQLKFAELEFKTLELEYRRSEQNADRMLSKANIDGMTVMQNIFRGSEFSQIQAGDQIFPGQFFMQIVDPNSMVINATINQVDGERLRVGAKAMVSFDAYPGLQVPAHIINIAAVPRSGGFRASFVREIPVLLKIDAMDKRIIPDLSCSVDVLIDEQKDATVAPVAGIFEDKETGKRFAYVREGLVWNRREVEVALETYLVASVKGLQKGEVIALETPPVVGNNLKS